MIITVERDGFGSGKSTSEEPRPEQRRPRATRGGSRLSDHRHTHRAGAHRSRERHRAARRF